MDIKLLSESDRKIIELRERARVEEDNTSLTLGGGGVQGQGNGQRLMTTFGWQHAKVESTKSNPPTPLGSKMLSC